jgi:prophage regulatory protein
MQPISAAVRYGAIVPRTNPPNTGKRLPAIPLEALPAELQGNALLTVRETMRHVGLAYSSLYEAMRLRDFPRPINIGGSRTNRWIRSEVDAWIAARVAERDARMPQSPAANPASTSRQSNAAIGGAK